MLSLNSEKETLSTEERKEFYTVPIEVKPDIKDFLEELLPEEKMRLAFLTFYLEVRIHLESLIWTAVRILDEKRLKTDWRMREALLKYAKVVDEKEKEKYGSVLKPILVRRVRRVLVELLKDSEVFE